MTKRGAFAVAVLLSLLVPLITQARWSRADIGGLALDTACRDGVQVTALKDGSGPSVITIGLRENSNNLEVIDSFNPPQFIPTPEAYGEVLRARATENITLTDDLNDYLALPSLTFATSTYTSTLLLFNRQLTPGSKIVLIYRGLVNADEMDAAVDGAVIGDCLLNPLNRTTLQEAQFAGFSPLLQPANQTFRLDQILSQATLRRDDTIRPEGSHVTLTDIQANRVNLRSAASFPVDLVQGSIAGTELVSVRRAGAPAPTLTNSSSMPAISANGRWVVFTSSDPDLVVDDTNNQNDIMLRDLQQGTTEAITRGLNGAAINGFSYDPAISADGRYVVFTSYATNLAENDLNDTADVFLFDRETGTTTLISRTAAGFSGDSNSDNPSISADGSYIVFLSSASNLVSNDQNTSSDVFLYLRQSGQLIKITRSTTGGDTDGGANNPVISGDGNWIAFDSSATNLVNNDTNNNSDVFVYGRQTGITTRVSQAVGGVQVNGFSAKPTLSTDGSWIAFESDASELSPNDQNALTDVYLVSRLDGTVVRGSVGVGAEADNYSSDAVISGDGRYLAFMSQASNLLTQPHLPTNPSIYRYDRQTGTTVLVAVSPVGLPADQSANSPSISADGRMIAFTTTATNLSPVDQEDDSDVYVRLVEQPVTIGSRVFVPLVRR